MGFSTSRIKTGNDPRVSLPIEGARTLRCLGGHGASGKGDGLIFSFVKIDLLPFSVRILHSTSLASERDAPTTCSGLGTLTSSLLGG
jgi:hypothetical protein